MAIKEYSLRKDGAKQLSPAFRVREFRCRDGTDAVLIDDAPAKVFAAQNPVHITSGYRTASYNARPDVNGSKSSQHLLGRAADLWVEGTTVEAVAAYAESLLPGRGGIGRYPKDAKHPSRTTGWVHIDTRPNKSRWVG